MRKAFTLALLFSLLTVMLIGCNATDPSGSEIKVTPALTPILSTGDAAPTGVAETPAAGDATVAGPVQIIAGEDGGSAQRTPVVILVPLTPAAPAAPAVAEAVNTPGPAAPTAGPDATATSLALPTPEPLATDEPAVEEEPTEEAYQGVPVSLDDTLNILVVGSDERHPGQPWRSDVIMVVAVDYANRQVGVISFPRDLYVDIPTVGKNRINTATFFGGVNHYPNGGDIGLLKDTLAQNFGIRIDHAVKFNFETFKDVIDALGGIDIAIICPITGRFPVEPGSKELVWQTLPAGQYHMDGEFALRYVRERKTTSDVDRNRRQQRVLIAMRKRAREVNIVPRIPSLYDAMKENIETDLGLTDIIALTRLGLQIDTKDVHGFNIGYKEVDSWTTPGGASVLKPDMAKIQEGIRTLFSKPSILKNPAKPRSCR
jgi:LCP family protein required for cell wall assembly